MVFSSQSHSNPIVPQSHLCKHLSIHSIWATDVHRTGFIRLWLKQPQQHWLTNFMLNNERCWATTSAFIDISTHRPLLQSHIHYVSNPLTPTLAVCKLWMFGKCYSMDRMAFTSAEADWKTYNNTYIRCCRPISKMILQSAAHSPRRRCMRRSILTSSFSVKQRTWHFDSN